MDGILKNFYFHFCKVEFLCWQGEPNWLGWIVVGIGAIILLWILVFILAAIQS